MSTQHEALSRLRLVLGFGRSAGGPDPLFTALEPLWQAAGLQVQHVALDAQASPDALVEGLVEAARQGGGPESLVLGGFSLGSRIAVQAAAILDPLALICLGHPFHARGEPGNRPGLAALRRLHRPTLIVQGSRDAYGNQQEVSGYAPLPPHIEIHWLPDGNHRFQPRERSGQTEGDHAASAAAACVAFLERTLESTRRA